MKKDLGFDLYLVTQGTLVDSSQAGGFFIEIEEALAGGVRAVQLREKELGGRMLLEVACKLRELTARYGAKLFINDRVDVALLSKADGVHLPVSGLSVKEVRGLLVSRGEELLIGASTHSLTEAQSAERSGADFITFGPVFYTHSKARYGEPVGLKNLAGVCESLDIPVFALGGVDRENLNAAVEQGAKGVAMIGAILGAKDILESTALIIEELRK